MNEFATQFKILQGQLLINYYYNKIFNQNKEWMLQ